MGNGSSRRNYLFSKSSGAGEAGRDVSSPYSAASGKDNTSAPPPHKGAIFDVVRWSETEVVTCSEDKSLALFDVNAREVRGRFKGHTKAITKVVAAADQHLWSCSRDLSLIQWDPVTHQQLLSIPDAHTLNITGLSYSNERNLLCSGSRDYSVKLWDAQALSSSSAPTSSSSSHPKAAPVASFSAPRNVVTCLKFDHTGNLVYQGSEDLCVRVWDCRSNASKPAVHISGYVYFPLSLDLSPTSAAAPLLATGCKGFNSVGCDVKVWDLRNAAQPVLSAEMTGHEHDVNGCVFVDDSHVVTSSKDGTCVLWDASCTSNATARGSDVGSDRHQLARYVSPDAVQFTSIAKMGADDVIVGGFNGTLRRLKIQKGGEDSYRFAVDFVSDGADEAKGDV